MTQLEKRFKEAWENLGIISGGLLNEDTIWSKSEVRDKQKQVQIICLQYFCIQALVEDRFDNIRAAITNNGKDIDLDLIDESRKRIYKKMLGEDDDAKED